MFNTERNEKQEGVTGSRLYSMFPLKRTDGTEEITRTEILNVPIETCETTNEVSQLPCRYGCACVEAPDIRDPGLAS
jgi:hypothetical protein